MTVNEQAQAKPDEDSRNAKLPLTSERAEDHHSLLRAGIAHQIGLCADVHFAVGNSRWIELRARPEGVARSGLAAVVEFGRQISRVIGMQYTLGTGILNSPHDAVLGTVGGYAGRRPWIRKLGGCLRNRRRRQQRIGQREGAEHVADGAIVNPSVEIGRRAVHAVCSWKCVDQLLPNLTVVSGSKLTQFPYPGATPSISAN